MNDSRVRSPRSGTTERPRVPGGPAGPDVMTEHLGMLAGVFARRQPDRSVTARSFLSEVFRAVSLYDDLSRGSYPPRGSVPRPSQAMSDFEAAVSAAVQHFEATASPTPPSRLSAGLEVPADLVDRDLQLRGSFAADEITLREAAGILDCSPEWPRKLAGKGKIEGWQESTGKHQWHVIRASVIAYRNRQRGSGKDGVGGSAKRRVA